MKNFCAKKKKKITPRLEEILIIYVITDLCLDEIKTYYSSIV